MEKMNDEMYGINSVYMATLYFKVSDESYIPIMETVMVERCLMQDGSGFQYSIIDGGMVSTTDYTMGNEYGIDDLIPVGEFCNDEERLLGVISKDRLHEIIREKGRNLCDQRSKHQHYLRKVLRSSIYRKRV